MLGKTQYAHPGGPRLLERINSPFSIWGARFESLHELCRNIFERDRRNLI